MPSKNRFSKNLLELEVNEDEASIRVTFKGKSVDRDPSDFITPVLSDCLDACSRQDKEMVLDFRELEFMSSSTITPVSRILEMGKLRSNRIKIIYLKSKKWQDLNFSALRIFETHDGRIEVMGID
jgi:hypothetical protein